LAYVLTTYMDGNNIEDEELRQAWLKAEQAINEFEGVLEKKREMNNNST